MDKANPTLSPASVDKQAALVAKLRYMGKQYAAGQVARGGFPQKHYLEEAADEIEMMAWALSMNEKTPASAQENADLRNVIQAACIDGLPGLSRAWEKYFPDHPITIKGAEVERLAAQAAPTDPTVLQQKAPRIGAVLMATELANALAEDGEGVKGEKRTFGHATSALLKQWSAEYFAAQAPVQPQAVRMLTREELNDVALSDQVGWEPGEYIEAVQRKFCAVNAGRTIPASGEIGSV